MHWQKISISECIDAFLEEKLILRANTEILLEYEEAFNRFWGIEVTNNLLGLFESSDNFEQVVVHYNWQLVNKDADDSKFIDTYIASGSDLLISHYSSITNLRNSRFPP